MLRPTSERAYLEIHELRARGRQPCFCSFLQILHVRYRVVSDTERPSKHAVIRIRVMPEVAAELDARVQVGLQRFGKQIFLRLLVLFLKGTLSSIFSEPWRAIV